MRQHSSTENARLQEKRREKRLVRTIGALFVVSGGIFGSLIVLERARANQSFVRNDSTIPDMKPEKQQARVVRARELRAKWEFWARGNANDLKAMRVGNRAAYNRVRNALPTMLTLERYGIHANDVCRHSVPFSFTFYLNTPISQAPNESREQFAKGLAMQQQMLRWFAVGNERMFVEQHDVPIFTSANSGSKRIQVWASGRITEVASIDNPRPRSGAPSFVEAHREIAPAYDFVR